MNYIIIYTRQNYVTYPHLAMYAVHLHNDNMDRANNVYFFTLYLNDIAVVTSEPLFRLGNCWKPNSRADFAKRAHEAIVHDTTDLVFAGDFQKRDTVKHTMRRCRKNVFFSYCSHLISRFLIVFYNYWSAAFFVQFILFQLELHTFKIILNATVMS